MSLGKYSNTNSEDASISNFLEKEYGYRVSPGKKGICPFCDKNTFSITSDDSLGKCFHPDCGRFITTNEVSEQNDYLQNALYEVCDEFRKFGLSRNSLAMNYLIDERKIDPGVIMVSMIGAVPLDDNYLRAFTDIIGNLKTEKINAYLEEKKLKIQLEIERITDVKDRLKEFLNAYRGWIVFFYTDETNKITRIKLRKPYTKEFVIFKFVEDKVGLFNQKLLYDQKITNNFIIACEGEIDALQLQSLAYSGYGKYINCCALGGAGTADLKTLAKLDYETIFIAYDNDDAGRGVVENAKDHFSFNAFTFPDDKSDPDSYVRGFGENSRLCFRSLIELIKNSELCFQNINLISNNINAIRCSKYKSHTTNSKVAKIIIDYFLDTGKFINDNLGNSYFHNKKTNSLIEISQECKALKDLLSEFTLNPTEVIYKYVVENLQIYARKNGKVSEVYNSIFYNKNTNIVYLYNFKDVIYKITKSHILQVPNGTDGVLFKSNNHEPFYITDIQPDIDYLSKFMLDTINFDDSGLLAEEYKTLLMYWFYGLFFESIMPTKPILVLDGEKGSGKTTVSRKISKLKYGKNANVMQLPKKEDDFDIAVANNYYLAIDNADSYQAYLNDRLACVATGSVIKKRKLYTDNTEVIIPTKCFLSITSRTPKFRRDDIADRSLIIKLARFKNGFKSDSSIYTELENNRNEIMSYVMKELQTILLALDVTRDKEVSTDLRMADFASFVIRIASFKGNEDEMKKLLSKMSKEQDNFTLEGDVLLELLPYIINKYGGVLRDVSASCLFGEMKNLSNFYNVDFSYKNAKAVAQRLKNIKHNCSDFIKIETKKGSGGVLLYTISLIQK